MILGMKKRSYEKYSSEAGSDDDKMYSSSIVQDESEGHNSEGPVQGKS